jgi:phosphoglycerate dehydrogenase-like enzyme
VLPKNNKRPIKMIKNSNIVFLDDDHIVRIARFAMVGENEISQTWAQSFFSPEQVSMEEICLTAKGVQINDGVELIPFESMGNPELTQLANIMIFRRGPITQEVLNQFPNLKFIQRLGERTDDIDLFEIKRRGITISCMPRKSLHLTAEHSILFMLSLSKQLIQGDKLIRQNIENIPITDQSNPVSYNWLGLDNLGGLFGQTLGIIGLGEVGSLLAKLALNFGMNVIYHNRTRLPLSVEESLKLRYFKLENLLSESDFVSINAANIPSNFQMVNSSFFKKMKKTAFFINTSRGQLVDEDALYHALLNHEIAGAAIDVHAIEPTNSSNKLTQLNNLIMTPHYAGGSRKDILEELTVMFRNCRLFLDGNQPLFCL